jgi:hypothetical protein
MRFHRPLFYRYIVAYPGFRIGLNRYGWKIIGWQVVAGKWAYSVKWAWADRRTHDSLH